jgi:hypothetical protein
MMIAFDVRPMSTGDAGERQRDRMPRLGGGDIAIIPGERRRFETGDGFCQRFGAGAAGGQL